MKIQQGRKVEYRTSQARMHTNARIRYDFNYVVKSKINPTIAAQEESFAKGKN